MSAGLGACGLFAALHALRRKLKTMEHEKRRVTELSARLSELLTNRATGDQLIQDLQLGMRDKGVDLVAREQAYETITKISRSNKDLRQHMKAIRMLIGKPIEFIIVDSEDLLEEFGVLSHSLSASHINPVKNAGIFAGYLQRIYLGVVNLNISEQP